MKEDLKNMELHEIKKLDNLRSMLRVVGGWVYFDYFQGSNSAVFVPEPKNNLTWKKY